MITQLSKSAQPRIPSPDELYSAGYRDATCKRSKHPQFRNHSDYLAGYLAGYQERPDSLFNLAHSPEAYLERGWGDQLLNSL